MNDKGCELMHYRGIIHVHSCFSYDSVLKPETIAKIAEKNKLNFIIVTDHETTNGAIEVQNIIKKRDLKIEVPLAAEYKTSNGDMIAAFIKKEIINMEFDYFCREVKEQDGIILFPHPFKGHRNIDYIAKKCDVIETFNSRVSKECNDKAMELAIKYKKPKYAGSDSHLVGEVTNTLLSMDYDGSLKEALLNAKIEAENKRNSNQYNIIISQYIKALKKRDIRLLASQSKNLIYQTIKGDLFRDI